MVNENPRSDARPRSEVEVYDQFSRWVQHDIKKDRVIVNRKILSVVLWCLILPAVLTAFILLNRKFAIVDIDRYSDVVIFLPPLVYVLLSLWPTLRDVPRVFRKGGLVALLEDSQREVVWREHASLQLEKDLKLNEREWKYVEFHLKHDLERMRDQNRYMTILAAAVLFLIFQFLDLGAPGDAIRVNGAQALVKSWVDQFSQWSFQFFSLALFTALFYLSGTQFHRSLKRYLVCVEKILTFTKFN